MDTESRPRRAAERALSGARLATVSVISGALATAASLSAVAYVAAAGSAPVVDTRATIRLASHGKPARSEAEGPHPVRERKIGAITLVDVGADVVSLDDELDRQRAVARREEERFVLFLVVSDCKACAAVDDSLESPLLQRALRQTRIVRLDAGDFLAELSRLGVPLDAFPSFVLLGPDGRATDFVDGSEWQKDTPPDIAPVLKSFVEGTYTDRKSPWRGGLHEDETPI
ncbi:MAG TPA: hypothetical protein VHE30_27085 [Polyangiaceae bacterium]|nr:hypothetical protein [Polyangiaceae bacterium]